MEESNKNFATKYITDRNSVNCFLKLCPRGVKKWLISLRALP